MLINTLEIILPSNKIEKKIPYSDNFLYYVDNKELNISKLVDFLNKQKENNNYFLNLIISSNPEISKFSFDILVNLIDSIKPFLHLFKYKYIRTNGDLLKGENQNKFLLIKNDYIIRIQRYALDDYIDNDFFGSYYNPSLNIFYSNFANFSNAKICFDIICLNDSSYESVSNIINGLIDKYSTIVELNIKTIKIYGDKITPTNIKDYEFSKWILDFAYRRIMTGNKNIGLDENIIDYLNRITQKCGLKFKEYWEWNYRNKRITMNKSTNLQIRYNKNHYIFYGNGLIDYSGNNINIDTLNFK